ncbi:MAG TPA: hypothetical protein VN804_06565, partial [Solirubrobacteraceae bacterium]|nr:hypothetical protein [Solirubrobacteraceae bacterium]
WNGHPSDSPALSIARAASGRGASVYASWNGASEVASWRVLAGPATASLAPVGAAARTGFETSIALPSLARGGYVEVQALNAAGAVIGASAAKRA